jgi:hypothetical protein
MVLVNEEVKIMIIKPEGETSVGGCNIIHYGGSAVLFNHIKLKIRIISSRATT